MENRGKFKLAPFEKFWSSGNEEARPGGDNMEKFEKGLPQTT